MFRGSIAISLMLAGLLAATGVSAHHSTRAYDQSKKTVVRATVKNWELRNPHARLDIVGADGRELKLESGPISILYRLGFRANTLKPGDKVTVEYWPRFDRAAGGLVVRVIAADGKAYGMPSGGPGK